MELVRPVSEDPSVYLPAIGIVSALLSLVAPACAFLWGYRRFGLTGAVLAGLVPAVWTDTVYFATHPLSEVVAAHLLVGAVFLGDFARSNRRLAVAAGALFALAGLIRFHLAPEIGVALLWFIWRDRRLFTPLVLGGVPVFLLGGLLDFLTWTYPWQTIWLYYEYDILYSVAAGFGPEPIYYYIGYLVLLWSGSSVVLAGLALIGARHQPLVFVLALMTLLTHMAIAHKELTNIYPTLEFGLISAGLGLAQCAVWAERLQSVLRGPVRSVLVPVTAGTAFALLSLTTAVNPFYQQKLFRKGAAEVTAARWVHTEPGLCGIGLQVPWWATGGYAHFHVPAPVFRVSHPELLKEFAPAFTVLVYPRDEAPDPELRYSAGRCADDVCVAKRPGGCARLVQPSDTGVPRELIGVPPLPRRLQ
jgi:hypothetical protein